MTQPRVATSAAALTELLAGIAHVDGERLVIDDEARFRDGGIRDVVWTATFSEDADTVEAARWMVWEASQELGAPSASIHDLYMARGRGEVHGFTVPAINLRTQVFDMARVIAQASAALDSGAVIFELARSEQEYTFQRPGEYITSVLAGAIAAGWQGPVFVQGDHYQFNAKKYAADPEGVTETLRKATVDALGGGLRQHRHRLLDAGRPVAGDRSTRSSAPTTSAPPSCRRSSGSTRRTASWSPSAARSARSARRTPPRRSCAPTSTATGGSWTRAPVRGAIGLSKVSVQTGTSHGGVPLPGGGVAEVKLDFGTLERLSAVCRSYGLAGAVQHGASTLPDELFHRFPQVETAEIHLATGFQNALYDHPAFPAELHADDRGRGASRTPPTSASAGETDSQFVYKTRKKALGAHKRELWELPTKDAILASAGRARHLPRPAAGVDRHQGDGREVRDGARAASSATRTRSGDSRVPNTAIAPAVTRRRDRARRGRGSVAGRGGREADQLGARLVRQHQVAGVDRSMTGPPSSAANIACSISRSGHAAIWW